MHNNELNKNGSGDFYFLHINDYDEIDQVGSNLDDNIDPTIVDITFDVVRIYRGMKMMRFLEAKKNNKGIKALLNFFKYHKAFHNPTLKFEIRERRADNKVLECNYDDSDYARITIGDNNLLLEIAHGSSSKIHYTLFHGHIDE
ncbi:MAG: hypothetical protein WD357_00305 [Gracilimonas sp.]